MRGGSGFGWFLLLLPPDRDGTESGVSLNFPCFLSHRTQSYAVWGEVFKMPFVFTQSVDPVICDIATGLQARLVVCHLDIAKLLYTQSNKLYIEKGLLLISSPSQKAKKYCRL
jgi:hypothetical protein